LRCLKNNRGSIALEFAVCGVMFVGFIMGLIVISLWIYNATQVSQAARIAAHNLAVTNDYSESLDMAKRYLNKTLVSCSSMNVDLYGSQDKSYGVAQAEMSPLFPGFQKLLDPKGTSTIDGRIRIRREAFTAREYRFRPGNQQYFN
jgi:Flp pilus assembly protein TadG